MRLHRDYRDIFGGALLIIGGTAFSASAATSYDMGILQRMGPGMFPAGLGIILAILGVLILVPAFFREGILPEIRIRSPFFILLGIAAFALLIRPAGLVPAIVAVTVISSLAETKFRPVSLMALCVVLCVLAWLTFRVGLGMPMPMLRNPFGE